MRNSRVQVFTSTGVFVRKWGSSGSGDGQFNKAAGVAVDGAGNVYVTDLQNNLVQEFVPPTISPTPTDTPSPTPTSTTTPTLSPTLTPTLSPTSTHIATPNPTPSPTPTNSTVITSSPSPTASQTPNTSATNYTVPATITIGIASPILVLGLVIFRRRQNTHKTKGGKQITPHQQAGLGGSSGNIFISYAKEDSKIAKEIAKNLETEGFATWYYERDSIPGQSYIIATSKAIEQAKAVILILSRDSLRSNQIHTEIVYTYEKGIHFIPILNGITHEEFQQSRPIWRRMLADATSINIPNDGIPEIIPRLIAGLVNIGVPRNGEIV
jgi:hypothetical protein